MDNNEYAKLFDVFMGSSNSIKDLEFFPGDLGKPIVVLVHGIGANASDWKTPLNIPVDSSWLYDLQNPPMQNITPGQIISSTPLKDLTKTQQDMSWVQAFQKENISSIIFSQKEPSGKLELAVSELELILKNLKQDVYDKIQVSGTNLPPLVLMGHSRGGLVIRQTLKSLKQDDFPFIRKIITLCTPHQGSYMPLLSQSYDKFMAGTNQVVELAKQLLFLVEPDAKTLPLEAKLEALFKNPPGVGQAKGDGFNELIPDSSLLQNLSEGEEPWPGVAYFGVAGSSPTVIKFYQGLERGFSRFLLTVSSPRLVELVQRMLPGIVNECEGLKELYEGDSAVALARAKWPVKFNAIHQIFPINHMHALVDPRLQETVVNLLLGKGFVTSDEIGIIENNTLIQAVPSTWFEDPAVSAVHDAFLLGWTNVELKSRLQIAAASRNMDALNLQPVQVDEPPLASEGLGDFILGLTERLINRRHNPLPEQNNTALLSLFSTWHALFNRLAALHNKIFPNSSTANTPFELKNRDSFTFLFELPFLDNGVNPLVMVQNGTGVYEKPLKNFELYETSRRTLNALLVLHSYDSSSSDILLNCQSLIAQIKECEYEPGVDLDILSEKLSIAIKVLTKLASEFLTAWDAYLHEQFFSGGQFKNDILELRAYDAGRSLAALNWDVQVRTAELVMTLNFLKPDNVSKFLNWILIATKRVIDLQNTPNNSSVFDIIKTALDNYNKSIIDLNTDIPKVSTTLNILQFNDSEWQKLSVVEQRKILQELPGKVKAFLNSATSLADIVEKDTTLPNLDKKALLTKITSAKALVKRFVEPLDLINKGQDNQLKLNCQNAIRQVWIEVFTESRVIEAKHQVAALCTTLDEAYYRVKKATLPVNQKDNENGPNPELPSQILHSVRHSLDYWGRVVSLLPALDGQTSEVHSGNKVVKKTGKAKKLSVDLSGKDNLVLDQNGEWCEKLGLALQEQSNQWLDLVSCQQNLRSFSAEEVTEKIIGDFMQDLELAGRKVVTRNGWLIILMVVILPIALGLLIYFITNAISNFSSNNNGWQGVLAAIGTVLGVLFGGTQVARASSAAVSAPQNATWQTFLTNLGGSLNDSFQKGIEQIKREFAYLNYNISTSYPLVEFFVLNEVEISLHPPKLTSNSNSNPGKPTLAERLRKFFEKRSFLWYIPLIIISGVCILVPFFLTIEWVMGTYLAVMIAGLFVGSWYLNLKVPPKPYRWVRAVKRRVLWLSLITVLIPVGLFVYLLIICITQQRIEIPISEPFILLVLKIDALVALVAAGVCDWYLAQSNRLVVVSQLAHNGYEFLKYVIWNQQDRDEVITRVVRAAFGPIGALIGSAILGTRTEDEI